jgi:hypothetical protein
LSRQFDQSTPFQATKHFPTGNLTKAPIGLAPVPDLAQTIGNMTAPSLPFLLNQLLDEPQVLCADQTAPNHQILVHVTSFLA